MAGSLAGGGANASGAGSFGAAGGGSSGTSDSGGAGSGSPGGAGNPGGMGNSSGASSSAGASSGGGGGGGAGGSAGSGQAGGGSAGSAQAGGGTSAGCPAGASFCTGFESAGLPMGATYRPSYQMGFGTLMKLSTAVKHAGTQALEVTGASGYTWNMLSVPAPAASFWVRLYLRSSVDIGQSEHNSYYQAMTGDGEPNAGDNVEVSEQYCQVVLNLHDDVVVSTAGTAVCGSGVPPLAKDTWHCMETFFDGPNGGVQVYADGAKIIDKSGWTKLSFKTFSFGYLGFHGPARTVWVDDVAVATTRVGCQ